MFGQSKPVFFDPYGRRRSRWRLPRWLVLMLVGIAIGVAGVVVVQERYLPPRLSAAESVQLREAYDQADGARQRLKNDLGETTKQLQTTLAEKKALTDQLAETRSTTERQRATMASLVATLPPDPRGAQVEVRAGRFAVNAGALDYDVVLTRERASGKPITGVIQFATAGASAKGTETTITSKPVAVTLGSHEVAHGSVPLPEGFKPRQTTIQILDREAGRALGMRVFLVK